MRRRYFCVTAAAFAISGWMSLGAASQALPDFSGRWMIEAAPTAPAQPPAGAPAPPGRPDQGRLTRGDMGSGWGSPLAITQDTTQLIVEPTLFSFYDARPQPRFVYALDGSDTRNATMIGHATQVRVSRAAWEGQVLRITTLYPGVDPSSGQPFTTEVTHRLSLESPTSLVIEVTRGAAIGGSETTTRTVYRRS